MVRFIHQITKRWKFNTGSRVSACVGGQSVICGVTQLKTFIHWTWPDKMRSAVEKWLYCRRVFIHNRRRCGFHDVCLSSSGVLTLLYVSFLQLHVKSKAVHIVATRWTGPPVLESLEMKGSICAHGLFGIKFPVYLCKGQRWNWS